MNNDEILKELRRELATRIKVYPGWIQSGKLTRSVAAYRIKAIESAILLIEEIEPVQKELL